MAVGLSEPRDILAVPGIRLATVYAGIRKAARDDLVLVEIAKGGRVAAVFTRNRFCAAPVLLSEKHLSKKFPRYLLINAGNANAGTGEEGLKRAERACAALARAAGCAVTEVLPFSTGVIGEHLPVEKIEQVLPELLGKLDGASWMQAARGIMTTDTVAKAVSRKLKFGDSEIVITGIAKGAGMICPNMATMLGFIATDAGIPLPMLDKMHKQAVQQSFNAITIDGDTSTNDACLLMATGSSGVVLDKAGRDVRERFVQALSEVYRLLAQAIVRDAEGATKFVTVCVRGGNSRTDCRKIAYAIAHSPLVKTALYASDANWGRILAAAGRTGVELNPGKVSLSINGIVIFAKGAKSPAYTEEQGARAMSEPEIEIVLDLGPGSAAFTVWTSDLSHEYVSINADYRS
ncbi:MAG TPA: bifunctional glutamate N-acetyltransferase/amino-acid acetyltransferase ArgJ [Gammaproteobacteria bacterium]|nr:bifunctional glutamate N-acetyltransferase/amino-acid acetyltransferase ArgJ [Gammaproteobacteria bacterium]